MSENPPPLPIQHQQLKFLAYEAITGGGRGIRFRSQLRLDETDPATQLRARTLRWLMRHLDQIEPWISGGLSEQRPSNSPSEQLHRIRLPDSRLILVQQTTGWEQFVAGDEQNGILSIDNPGNSISDRAYLINELGAQLIPDQRKSTGIELNIENDKYAAAALVTSSPGPIAYINQVTGRSNPNSLLQDRIQLTRQSHGVVRLIHQKLGQLGQATTAEILGVLDETDRQLRTAQQRVSTDNPVEALRILQVADAASALIRRKWMNSRFRMNSGIAVSPLLMHVCLLPENDTFSARLASANWNPNSLTGGDFENLQQMLDSGWTNRRADMPEIATQVTLDKSAARDGNYGLKLLARQATTASIVPAPPVWIKSADVIVKKGQLVRIHGYVNLPQPLSGTGDGLIIIDSLGGPDMASRILQTAGWQEFTFYRAAERDGRVNVTFMLTGLGSALIDEVTIRSLDRSTASQQARQSDSDIK